MAKKPPAAPRDHTVSLKLSPQEFQLIDYAASKSNARGTSAWMRTQLVEAAKARLSEKIVDDIMSGSATIPLMKESLKESRSRKRERRTAGETEPSVVDIASRRKRPRE